MSTTADPPLNADEQRLKEMGYEQTLQRAWGGFSNFAISFTIISVLAGCFTTYGQAWNNGGPIAISWGWPIISCFILIIAFCMAELVSAYPTSGGIYWWAAELGGAAWGWFTGWFNLIGLIAVVASVDYAAATFLNVVLGLYSVDLGFINFADDANLLVETFVLFALILTIHALLNIFSSPLVALFNTISVWWHVLGVAVIIVVLIVVPDQHRSFNYVFTERINNSGFSMSMYWFYILPVGGLLTMYTITGYDASAHVSEETHNAAETAPKGVWRSVFYSAIIGWIVLLAITFAANDPDTAAFVPTLFESAMSTGWVKLVLIISTVGQLFCGMACLTSCSRMMYAFSRDGAVPGHQLWTRLNHHRVPAYSVLASAVAALIITLPALKGFGEAAQPVAFFAVVSIAVIGLYIAYAIPIFLRWRMGDAFTPGPWTLGAKYKWMCPIAVVWVALCTLVFSLPITPAAVWFKTGFTWEAANYAPLVVGAVVLGAAIAWFGGKRNTFTGPKKGIKMEGDGLAVSGD